MKSFSLFHLPLTLLFSTVAFSEHHGNETDRAALLDFKNQLPESPAMSSWNSSLHFCEWEGITCAARHQRVMALDMQSQGLRGSISASIGNLSFLRTLLLQNNSLYGEIPHQLGHLFRLNELRLHNNSLSGSLPVNLSRCIELVFFSVSNNDLSGKIPEELGSLRNLKHIFLRSNHFSGKIPTSFGNLSSVQTIILSTNRLTGTIPDIFGQSNKIVHLEFAGNLLSGMLPPSIYNLSSLTHLFLPVNQLRGTVPHDIGLMLPNLRVLAIGGNQFSGLIPISLFTNSSQLELLDLPNNSFTGGVPVHVGSLKRLQRLNLDHNHLGSNGEVDDLNFFNFLSNSSHLSILSIQYNDLGGILPSSLVNFSNTLTKLYIGGNQIFGSIPSDIGKLSNLIGFTVAQNLLTGTIPTSIGMLHKVERLSLSGNRIAGTIPYSIGNMSSLYSLILAYNMLEGNIVTSIGQCRNLKYLELQNNNLTGVIPEQLFGSSELSEILLNGNNFIGSLPSEVGSLKALRWLTVADNKLSGEIPVTLGSCLSLEKLYLQGNSFQGLVPSSFKSLRGILEIDLSRNNLSGNISQVFRDLPDLQTLNLSFNNFGGEVPIEGIFRNLDSFSIVGNENLCGGILQLGLPNCSVHKSMKKGMPLALKVTLGVIFLSFIISFSFIVVFCWRKRHGANRVSIRPENSLPRVSYIDLYHGTSGFSSEKLIGMGSYGYVYKGVLDQGEHVVAVKVLNLMENGASKSFIAECDVLRSIRHRNLLKILTFCSSVDFKGNDFKALVFEFMSNGSLEQWLHPRLDGSQRPSGHLNILQRLNVAIDVASAMDYLHNQCERPIIHCDLKPSNVLLDDDMVGYVADFGLAKFLVKNTNEVDGCNTNSIAVRGTIGYIPPEYGMGVEVSTQGDIYIVME